MTIICVSGSAGAGKDTFGDVLIKKHGFTRVALADPLRELCSKVFHMPYNDFLDPAIKDKRMDRVELDYHHIDKIRDIVQNEWGYNITYEGREEMEEYFGEEFDTPRDILRCIGTKLIRNNVKANIWIELALAKISTIGEKVVVTDCRFENERDAFNAAGATMILIKRGEFQAKEHEHDLGKESDYDIVFDNSGTLTEFQSNVDMWYTIRRDELKYHRVFTYV